MLDIAEVDSEIAMLEGCEMSYPVLEKLSILYSIRDNASTQARSIDTHSEGEESEFITAVRKAKFEDVLQIMDEHFECIKVLYPKEYMTVLRKIVNS